jgi:glycerophosphoryl diester phosphodiesterase
MKNRASIIAAFTAAVGITSLISASDIAIASQLKDKQSNNNKHMIILGHRGTGVTVNNSPQQEKSRKNNGLRGPENTLKAVKLALDNGADGIEIDVFRTKDNKLAVIHDDDISTHIPGIDGSIEDYTMTELSKMDAGDDEPIPSLAEIFDLAAKYDDVYVNIELKGKNTYNLAYQAAIQSGHDMGYVIFSSKHKSELKKLSKLDDGLNIGYIFLPSWRNHFSEQKVEKMLNNGIELTSLHIRLDKVSDRMINYANKQDMDVIIFTYDEEHPSKSNEVLKFAEKYKDADNVHVITDYPAEIKRALEP